MPQVTAHRICLIAVVATLCGASLLPGFVAPAAADKLKHPVAVFSGLDKITGRIITFEVATNETVQFGSLQITERVCYSRPPTEAPQTDSFLEIDSIDADNKYKRVFTGWMFAGSPSLHALDHPVYDIWLLGCKGEGQLISEAPPIETPPPLAPAEAAPPAPAPAAIPAPAQPARNHRPPAATDTLAAPAGNSGNSGNLDSSAPIEVGPPPGFSPSSDAGAPQPSPTQAPEPGARY